MVSQSKYALSDAYIWYQNKEQNIRREGLPVFESDKQGRVIVGVSEVYCRLLAPDDSGNLCAVEKKFINRVQLCKHLKKKHGVEVVPAFGRGFSADSDEAACKFYLELQQFASKKSTEIITRRRKAMSKITTPTSTRKRASSRRKESSDKLVSECMSMEAAHRRRLDDHKAELLSHINTKEPPSYTPDVRCYGCSVRGRSCPTTERDQSCSIWDAYARSDSGPFAALREAHTMRLPTATLYRIKRSDEAWLEDLRRAYRLHVELERRFKKFKKNPPRGRRSRWLSVEFHSSVSVGKNCWESISGFAPSRLVKQVIWERKTKHIKPTIIEVTDWETPRSRLNIVSTAGSSP
ncbi:hypothetical protein BJ166DRAFT_534214 [Pestalotiopsis sp. NC0098]|nr:hypothetical protein BJ166DRAFT_534214 [Pestalotiopsis sp. NC0098]